MQILAEWGLVGKKMEWCKKSLCKGTHTCVLRLWSPLNSLMSSYVFSSVHSFVDDEDFKPGVSLDYVRWVGDQSALVSDIHIFSKLLCLLDLFFKKSWNQ